MERGRVPCWVWMTLMVAHALAMAWALRSGHWNFPDSGRYRMAAQNIRQHGKLYARAWPDKAPHGQAIQEFTIRPPGYPILLAALGDGNGSPWIVLLVQNGLSLLGLGMVLRWWAKWAKPMRRHWVGALAMVLTFPAQLIYANVVMSEVFLQTLLLAFAAVAVGFYRTGNLRYWLGVASVVVMAFLFKPVCGLLVLVVGITGVVMGWQQRRLALVVVGLLPMLAMGGYMAWNQQRTGYFHFSSITEINLLHYNAAGVVRQVQGHFAEEAWVAKVLQMADAQPDFAARQRLIVRQAEVVLRAHPGVYVWQHLLGTGTFFLDPGRFDISAFLGLAPLAGGGLLAQVRAGGLWQALRQLPLGLLAVLLAVLLANAARLALAVRGFRRLGRGPMAYRVMRWVAVGLLAYLALLTGPLGAARFLMPAWPLLLGLALAGLHGPVEPAVMPEAAGANG